MSVVESHPLVAARESQNLDRKQLAKKSGVSLFAIERIETGLTRMPQQRTLDALADALAVDPADLGSDIGAYRARA